MAKKTLEVILRARDRASRVFGRVGKRAEGMGDRMARAGRKMRAALAPVGTAAAAAGTFAVVQGFRKAITAGADFEHTMDRVRALTSGTDQQMQALTATARELGRTTQFSATQAADAMSFFSLAGFSVAETMRAMKPTLNLAAAGQLDIATSADIAAKIMAGMGIEAGNLGETVDVLAKAFTTANTDLRQLGEAMGYVGPVAKSAGLDVQETTAAIQTLSNAGMQGEKAGTTLRNVLLKLTSPSAKAQGVMDRLGLTATNAQGEMRPLADIIEDLSASMAGIGRGQRLGLLSDMFEQRAATGVAAMLEAGSEQLRTFEANLRSAGGTAQSIAGTQLDNVTGSTIKLGSAMESVGITIYNQMQAGLRAAVDFSTSAANTLEKIIPSFANVEKHVFGPMVETFRTAGGMILQAMRATWDAVGNVIVAGWRTGIAATRAAWQAIGATLQTMGSGFAEVFGWLGENTGNTMEWMAQAMTRGFARIEFALTHWKDIAQSTLWKAELAFVSLGESIKHHLFSTIPRYLDWFGQHWRTFFLNLGDLTLTVFEDTFRSVGRILSNLPQLMRGTVRFSDLVDFSDAGAVFNRMTRDMPEVRGRARSETEKALAAAIETTDQRLGRSFGEFMNERLRETERISGRIGEALRFDFGQQSGPNLPAPGGSGGEAGGRAGAGRSRGVASFTAAGRGAGGGAGGGGQLEAIGLRQARFLRFAHGPAARSPEQEAARQRKRLIEKQDRTVRAIETLAQALRDGEGRGLKLDIIDGNY